MPYTILLSAITLGLWASIVTFKDTADLAAIATPISTARSANFRRKRFSRNYDLPGAAEDLHGILVGIP
ncbi:MAG: hypothetical protein QW503_03880 [Sulfolobales archaeon]